MGNCHSEQDEMDYNEWANKHYIDSLVTNMKNQEEEDMKKDMKTRIGRSRNRSIISNLYGQNSQFSNDFLGTMKRQTEIKKIKDKQDLDAAKERFEEMEAQERNVNYALHLFNLGYHPKDIYRHTKIHVIGPDSLGGM